MGKKFDEYNKGTVSFFGFKFETKPFWITMGCAVAVLHAEQVSRHSHRHDHPGHRAAGQHPHPHP